MIILECGLSSPSAIVRGLQYRDLFAERGIETIYASRRFPVMDRLVRRGGRFGHVAYEIDHRIVRYNEDRIVERAADCDVVYSLKVPSSRLHEKLCGLKKTKVMMDLNDGLWLKSFRRMGWEKLEDMLASSYGVICENDYVASYAQKYNSRLFIVPDAPQVEVFDQFRLEARRDPEKVVLGWVGSSFNVGSLYLIWEVLEDLFARYPQLHLRIVGVRSPWLPPFANVRWSLRESYNQAVMAQEILTMDIGLFPLFNVEDSLARGTLKTMVYMCGEAVAMCQNLGENPKLIEDGVNGVLASTPDEWRGKLEELILDAEKRKRIGRAGLETIRERFSKRRCFEKLLAALESACPRNGVGSGT